MKKRFVLLVSLAALAFASFGMTQAIGATGPNEGRSSEAAVPGTAAGMPPTAQTLWAVVNANGSLARGFGVVSATRVAAGNYQVVIRQNVTGCAYIATIGNAGIGTPVSGEITTAARAGNVNAVFVHTRNSAGTSADRPFHLAVHC